MRKCAFLTVLVLLLFGGCKSKTKFSEEELALIPLPQRTGLPEVSGGLTLAVSGEAITADEIVVPLVEHYRPIAQNTDFERFKREARGQLEQAVTARVSNILLYNQTKKQVGERLDEILEKAVETEVRKFVARHESDYAKAEEALRQMGMDWQSFREYQKKLILSHSYIQKKLPEQRPITYSELIRYYDRMKEEHFATPAMLRFRLIDIEAAKLETIPEENHQEKAKTLANELVRRIYAGEDFGALAKQYSHGHRRIFGGLWRPVQPGALAEPYDILAVEAEKIKPGQVAGPIEAGEHIFIMKLEERRAKSVEPFEKVQKQVEAKIILERRKKAFDEVSTELVRQANIGDKDKFIDFCLEKIYRMCNE